MLYILQIQVSCIIIQHQRDTLTVIYMFQKARERRNHVLAHFPSKPEYGSPENSESDESTSDYDDYYQYDDLDGSESSESSESDDSDDDDNPEGNMEPNLRWFAIDSSINRLLENFVLS